MTRQNKNGPDGVKHTAAWAGMSVMRATGGEDGASAQRCRNGQLYLPGGGKQHVCGHPAFKQSNKNASMGYGTVQIEWGHARTAPYLLPTAQDQRLLSGRLGARGSICQTRKVMLGGWGAIHFRV
jgi:hypothetical protein